MEIEQETVYGTTLEDSHIVMSEKVQSLAGSIYQEFEKMIGKYDENVVKDLMPLVVNVLECLDLAFTENQEHEVELELLREDNEQLVTQYEREKQLRKGTEQKLLELEDAVEEENKDLNGKIESLESIVRMFELKTRNSNDHVSRLEDKEQEMKKEYAKLHERYTELFKTHMDYMERTKILMGTDRLEHLAGPRRPPTMGLMQTGRSTGPVSYGFASMEPPKSLTSPPPMMDYSSITIMPSMENSQSNTSLKSELKQMESTPSTPNPASGVGWVEGELSPASPLEEDMLTSGELEDIEDIASSSSSAVGPQQSQGHSRTNKEQRTVNTLYQELSFQDNDVLGDGDEGTDITGGWVHPGEYSSSANDNFFGMGKEVENLILENNELLATKNALNIVKDDLISKVDELTSEQEILREEIKSLQAVKSRLRLRVSEVEDELRRVKEEAQKSSKANKSDDEEDVPMAQRKRFTRVEMARVLMERNQYKERFMELQEAVRWTEMIRASRLTDPTFDKKNKQSIWKFFSNLFSTPDKPQRANLPYSNVCYNAPSHHISPSLDTMRRRGLSDRRRGHDFLDSETSSEKVQQRRATERKEQYRQVRAHVRKDDGRMQAYGWSLPSKGSQSSAPYNIPSNSTSKGAVPVPVPVYCRPLLEKEQGMKIWCAAGVNLRGGRTRDGGSIVGASVFYSRMSSTEDVDEESNQEIEQINKELRESMEACRENESGERLLSSLVWICTSTPIVSKVTIIDANNPADVLESFHVCQSHLLCIASVAGAQESDYPTANESNEVHVDDCKSCPQESESDDALDSTEEPSIGNITYVSCATGESTTPQATNKANHESDAVPVLSRKRADDTRLDDVLGNEDDSIPPRRLLKNPEGVVKDGLTDLTKEQNDVVVEQMEKMSSVLPTMWLGAQSGALYVHSAVAQWRRCIHTIRLRDSVLSIVHQRGRVLVALADGTVAFFRRGCDGQWDMNSYHVLDLGKPHHSIRCMAAVHQSVWCAYRNRLHVVDPATMAVVHSFDAHPRRESQVRQLSWLGDGVWVSIRLDSTLRLFHAHTYQHLQDVDIEPYVSKMLGTGKLGFSFVRITALLISSNRLWIGTGNGVVISVPLIDSLSGSIVRLPSPMSPSSMRPPGGMVRVFTDGQSLAPLTSVPYCSMAQAQLSFHGHRDAVKFFVAVPGSGGMSAASVGSIIPPDVVSDSKPSAMLVTSGGEGYIDFRIGDGDDPDELEEATESITKPNTLSRGERSHLIVWEVQLDPQ